MRRLLMLGVASLVSITLAGCSGSDASPREVGVEQVTLQTPLPAEPVMSDDDAAAALAKRLSKKDFVEEKAIAIIEKNGNRYRVVQRDEVSFPVTADYSPTRLNLVIKKGKVVKVTVG